MAFGQQSGPPAPGNKIRALLELLQAAGHSDFRDARGPMGFTQRQAGGKFTRDEADAFIEQLEEAAHEGEPPPPPPKKRPTASRPAVTSKTTTNQKPAARSATSKKPSLEDVPSDQLAAELQRRGWIVMEQ